MAPVTLMLSSNIHRFLFNKMEDCKELQHLYERLVDFYNAGHL